MLRYILILFLASAFATIAAANEHYSSIKDFLSQQKVIRIMADDAPGYGLQAASVNLTLKLRELGFNGKYEFIYSTRVTDKITTLFDLPRDIPEVYDDVKDGIEFISLKEFVKRRKDKTAAAYTLGMSGGLDKGPSGIAAKNDVDILHGMDQLDYVNHANFMNVKVFAQLITFYKYPNYIYIVNDSDYKNYPQKGSNYKFITARYASLKEAENYLKNDERGRLIAQQRPALSAFIDGMEKQQYNVLPVYGITIQNTCHNRKSYSGCFPGNILQIIAGARYAQLNGPAQFHKPLVIAVFYDFENEAKQILRLIHDANWGNYEMRGAAQARKSINELGLQDVFSIANVSDAKTINTIHELKAGQILLLWLGPAPKIVFDGIYNHTGSNIWPQIREGNNTFATLILTGKPHLRCGNEWELGDLQMSDPLFKTRFADLYNKRGFCKGMKTWSENTDLYKSLGEIFIDASDPDSSLSRYFAAISKYVKRPENDRLRYALQEVVRIANRNT